ncbi:triose-phosphate isomerase [Candidatus Pacearchaeota archaeon]|nr:triose-phosphate isomerase [Candidatus Pacearchaeota archaeon]
MIVINLKNYKFGQPLIDLVRTIDIYCNKAHVAVPHTDVKEIVKSTTLPVYAQHVDYQESERATGFILPEALQSVGARGSLLNHSEHPISFQVIKKTIQRCKELNLRLIVCTDSIAEAEKLKKLDPFAIAYENPKLIATGKPITAHDPKDLLKFVEVLKGTDIIPLCGAGITSAADVKEALKLGCKGILVASAVAHSQNPEKFLKEVSALF